MLVDKTNFGLVLYNHANFNRFEESSSYWSAKRISVFLCFLLANQQHTSSITVFNRTVTNIENSVRACIAAIAGWLLSASNHGAKITPRKVKVTLTLRNDCSLGSKMYVLIFLRISGFAWS